MDPSFIAALSDALSTAVKHQQADRYRLIQNDIERLRQLQLFISGASTAASEAAWRERYQRLLGAAYDRAGLTDPVIEYYKQQPPQQSKPLVVKSPSPPPCCDHPVAIHGVHVGCFTPGCYCRQPGGVNTSYSGAVRATLPMAWRDAAWDAATVEKWWNNNLQFRKDTIPVAAATLFSYELMR